MFRPSDQGNHRLCRRGFSLLADLAVEFRDSTGHGELALFGELWIDRNDKASRLVASEFGNCSMRLTLERLMPAGGAEGRGSKLP